jgi:hypothetical protein
MTESWRHYVPSEIGMITVGVDTEVSSFLNYSTYQQPLPQGFEVNIVTITMSSIVGYLTKGDHLFMVVNISAAVPGSYRHTNIGGDMS